MYFYTNVKSSKDGILITYVKDGKRYAERVEDFMPRLYTPDVEGTFKCIDGTPLKEHLFDNVKDYKKFIDKYSKVSNVKIYGQINPEYQYIREHFKGKIDFDKKFINTGYYDIEVSPPYKDHPKKREALNTTDTIFPVVSISLYHSMFDTMVVFGCKDFDINKSVHKGKYKIVYKKCANEAEMLIAFMNHITSEKYRVDILQGWHASMYDIIYLINRITKIIPKKLNNFSPFGIITNYDAKKKDFGKWLEYKVHDIKGITHIDSKDAYKMYGGRPQQPSYALDYIGNIECGMQKLSYGDHRHILDSYHDDFQTYIDYNMQDTYIIKCIDDKVGFTDRILSMAYTLKCNFFETIGTTKKWDVKMYNYIHDLGMVIPPMQEGEKVNYAGGYVRDSLLGVHKWLVGFDFESLYPLTEVAFNMSYETLVHEYVENCITTPNGTYFYNDKIGIFPSVIMELFKDRKLYKQLAEQYEHDPVLYELYDVNQYVTKILLNSLYGCLGNRFFRYYRPEIAEAITLTGQHLIKRVAIRLNLALNKACGTDDVDYIDIEMLQRDEVDVDDYIVMGDTDSCVLSFQNYVKMHCVGMDDKSIIDEIRRVCNEIIAPEIKDELEKVYEECGVTNKVLNLQFEGIYKTGIYLVKKHYIAHVVYEKNKYYLDENDPYLKIKGVEAVKSSTPSFFKDKLKEFYKIAVTKDEKYYQQFMEDLMKEYKEKGVFDSAKPIKGSNLEKWYSEKNIYVSGTGEQAKACLIYNHYLKVFGLEHIYDPISDGDYCKLIKLKEPNPLKVSCIAIPNDYIPPEFGIDDYIGYDIHLEKYFLKPLSNVLKLLKWQRKKKEVKRMEFI